MKFLALFALFVVVASKNVFFDIELNENWKNFKSIFAKSYDEEEEADRRRIWERHLADVARHNLLYDLGFYSFTKGINEFSDMEHDEFVKIYNGFRLPVGYQSNASSWLSPSNVEIPSHVDWRYQGLVTHVKNQKQCGSCWAFSSTGSLEGQHKKRTGRLISLSEQNLVDCTRSFGNQGCNGGWMDSAFEYVRRNRGIDREDAYPYTARDGNCRFNPWAVGATVSGHVVLPNGNEEELKKAVATVGPISVAINSGHPSFQSYRGGIYYEPACRPDALDHAVLVVGYGSEGGSDYWLVKNSWGTSWGIGGYIKMSRNRNNNCGIATHPVYPLV